jgi:spore germination protein KB
MLSERHILGLKGVHMEKLTQNQMASMIILFQIGSTSLFLLASDAGKDAWISVLIAMLAGLLLLVWVTLPIYRREPGTNLVELLMSYFGKPIGFILSVFYILYFSYQSVRNVREFGDLSILYLLPQTPLWVIMLIVCLIAGYAIFLGIDVFFRMGEVLLPIVLLIYALLFLFIILSGLFQLNHLLPVLDEGLKPVLKAALPEVISFPFGEMLLFLMFWKYVEEPEKTSRLTVQCYLFSGFFITLTNVFIIAGMGKLGTATVIPLMELTNLIAVAKFLERIDPLVALLLFTGVALKLIIYYLAAVLAVSHLVKCGYRYVIIPVGLVIYFSSFLFESYMHHVLVGFKINVNYDYPFLQIVVPLLLSVVVRIRRRNKRMGIGKNMV